MLRRVVITCGLVATLSACAHTNSWVPRLGFLSAPVPSAAHFDFNWELRGDRDIAPVQLFSSNKEIWLQFMDQQALPAIFAQENEQLIPLQYKHQAPYVIIQGTWSQLVFRGGALVAHAQRKAVSLSRAFTETVADEGLYTQQESVMALEQTGSADLAVEVRAIDQYELSAPSYSVSPHDQTMRHALKRWAEYEGWLFEDQQWEVDIDFPIVSSAEFTGDFIQAVAQLMRSTSLGLKPLQACAYNNKVLRVIPLAQTCDPSAVSYRVYQG